MNKAALTIDYYLQHIEAGETPETAAKQAGSFIDYIYSDRYTLQSKSNERESEITRDLIKRLSAIINPLMSR